MSWIDVKTTWLVFCICLLNSICSFHFWFCCWLNSNCWSHLLFWSLINSLISLFNSNWLFHLSFCSAINFFNSGCKSETFFGLVSLITFFAHLHFFLNHNLCLLNCWIFFNFIISNFAYFFFNITKKSIKTKFGFFIIFLYKLIYFKLKSCKEYNLLLFSLHLYLNLII